MFTRRLFVPCALCAVTGFVGSEANAQPNQQSAAPTATPGVSRRILQQTEGPAAGYVTLLVAAEIDPNAMVARHTHPGIESAYFLTGGGELSVKGSPTRQVKAGDGIQVPPETPHSLKNGAEPTKIVVTYVVEKGKPLASPAPE
ncbi:MAG TPA: cupin domain-containing protein [Acetobacteraceae bacterium]|nr:cupin domain-containing protein [Acetobacteraceae bacterium]